MQDSQLQEMLRLLRTLVPSTATPSTPTTPLPHTTTRGPETPIAAASTAPTPLEAVPEGAVVAPDTQNEAEAHPLVTVIARATEAPAAPVTNAEVTPVTTPSKSPEPSPSEAKWREFKRHDPMKFYGGTDVKAAELFLKNHEKIHSIIATEDHMRATISSSMLHGEADDWWTTIITTRGVPRDWIDFKTQFNQKYFPPTVLRAKRNEFMALRQGTNESVMEYMGRFSSLLPYAGGSVDTETDRVYYFTEGLLLTIGGSVVTTQRRLYRLHTSGV
ncbi:hypothetical protein Syun_009935 [Stephania yunnanensis]|uniref:Retrotransposon gag domain-containing protein n=1 Tax=Stephania yunnanensis TaxID=152371 RepID=A0AAP0KFF4_9MAGN